MRLPLCMVLIPLTHKLNRADCGYQVHRAEKKICQLLDMSDSKLLGRSEEDLEIEIKHMKAISKHITTNFGLENGTKISFKKSTARASCTLEVQLRRNGPDKSIQIFRDRRSHETEYKNDKKR